MPVGDSPLLRRSAVLIGTVGFTQQPDNFSYDWTFVDSVQHALLVSYDVNKRLQGAIRVPAGAAWTLHDVGEGDSLVIFEPGTVFPAAEGVALADFDAFINNSTGLLAAHPCTQNIVAVLMAVEYDFDRNAEDVNCNPELRDAYLAQGGELDNENDGVIQMLGDIPVNGIPRDINAEILLTAFSECYPAWLVRNHMMNPEFCN